ncbi:hypothetical protein Tco_1240530, partial [Tanacetum coccineum]
QSSYIELDLGLVIPSFNPSDDPIANLNKLMAFVTTTFGPRFLQINNQLRTSSNLRNQATIQNRRVTVKTVQGRQTPGYANNGSRNTATNQGVNRQGAASQARVVKCYNYQEEEIPTPSAFQTDDLDAFDSDCDDVHSAKAVLMANLSSYDSDVLLEENIIVNATLNAELERYKEKLKISEQRQKFDLNDREKYIDGQLRQVIVDRNAKVTDFEKQKHSLKLQLNAIVKSHKTLSTTIECLKKESKQKEDKYLDKVIGLQKKNKARRKVLALYDGHTIVKTHVALFVTDTEETLELAENSKLKMLANQNDPSLKEKKVNIALVDYMDLNKLSEHFVPRKQLPTK